MTKPSKIYGLGLTQTEKQDLVAKNINRYNIYA